MLTDGRTDNGRKVITIAHPEQSSGELKMTAKYKFYSSEPLRRQQILVYCSVFFFFVCVCFFLC